MRQLKALTLTVVVTSMFAWPALVGNVEAANPTGKVVVAVSALLEENLDVHRLASGGAAWVPNYYTYAENLARQDEGGNWIPGIATSWKRFEDRWEFTIRKGVKFHDGSTLTPEDVKFSFDRMADPKSGARDAATMRRQVKKVEVRGDTVVFWTNDPVGAAMLVLAPPMPAAYVKRVGDAGVAKYPIGAGPWKFVRHVRGEYIEFEAFEDYYDPTWVPAVRTLILKIVPDPMTQVAMLRTGEADIITSIPMPVLPSLRQTPGIQVMSNPNTRILELTIADLKQPDPSPLKDPRVRKALALAIDRGAIAKAVFFGEASGQVSLLIPPHTMGYDSMWKAWPYEPERAKKLLAEAGYEKGFVMNYTVQAAPEADAKAAEAMADYFRKIGVDVKFTTMEAGSYYGQYRGGKLRGVAQLAYRVERDPIPMDSAIYRSTGPFSMVKDPKVDELIDAAGKTLDQDKRATLYRQLGEYITFEQAYAVPGMIYNVFYAAGPRVAEWRFFKGVTEWPSRFHTIRLKGN